MSRIISYDEKTRYNDGDYLLIDSSEGGTKRIRADRVGVQLDPTLTQPGQAADAKKTGDEITNLKEDLNDTLNSILSDGGVVTALSLDYEQGDINPRTGAIVESTAWYHTRFISADEVNGSTYANTVSGTLYVYAYYDNGAYWKRLADVSINGSYTFPDDYLTSGYKIRFTQSYNKYSHASFSKVIQSLATIEDLTDLGERVTVLENPVIKITLPAKCYAVVGHQFNIYTDNVVLCDNLDNYVIRWICSLPSSRQFHECYRVTPTAQQIGDYSLTLQIRDKATYDVIIQKTTTLYVIAETSLTGKNVIFIGDSLTNAGYYVYEIQHNLSSEGVTSLGTVTSHPWFNNVQVNINHEGRGGWSASNYVSLASKNGDTNAFWNPTTSKFDFSYYMTAQDYATPDLVCITLGTNDTDSYEANVSAITEMITSVHAYNSNIPVLVALITPPATQDGWTYGFNADSVDRYKYYQVTLNQDYLDAFDNVISNVYIVPVVFNIDRVHDFPYEEVAVSARNPYIVQRQTNNVHLSVYGYLKMADIYWGMIQHLLS